MSQLTVIYRQRNALLLRIAELNNRGHDVEESIVMLLQTCNEYSDLLRRQQQARSERAEQQQARSERAERVRLDQQDARMRLFQIEATPIKENMLAKAELNAPMAEECGICLEKHIMKDSVTTSCDHHFGKDCFQQWYTTCRMNALGVRCPTCRTNNPKTNGYRECEAPVVLNPGVILIPRVRVPASVVVLNPGVVLIPRVRVPASAVVVLNPDVVRIPRIRVPASVVVVLNPGVVLIPRVRVPASAVVVLNPDVVRIPRIRVPASVVVVLNPGVVLIPRVRVPASMVV